MSQLNFRSRRGLSLIDMVVSVGILMVLSVFTVAAIGNALDLNNIMKQREANVRGTLAIVRRDLQQAYLTSHIQAKNTFETVFVLQDEDPDTLYFVTRANKRMYRDGRESDLAEVTLWMEPMPDSTPGNVLYLRRSPQVDDEPAEGGKVFPIAYNVKGWDIRLLDPRNGEWREEWDSRSSDYLNTLPRAAEIAMVFFMPNPKKQGEYVEQIQKTTILLEFSLPVVRSALEDQDW